MSGFTIRVLVRGLVEIPFQERVAALVPDPVERRADLVRLLPLAQVGQASRQVLGPISTFGADVERGAAAAGF